MAASPPTSNSGVKHTKPTAPGVAGAGAGAGSHAHSAGAAAASPTAATPHLTIGNLGAVVVSVAGQRHRQSHDASTGGVLAAAVAGGASSPTVRTAGATPNGDHHSAGAGVAGAALAAAAAVTSPWHKTHFPRDKAKIIVRNMVDLKGPLPSAPPTSWAVTHPTLPVTPVAGAGAGAAAGAAAGGAAAQAHGHTFSVMQWNCLADYLADEKSFPSVGNAKEVLSWAERKELLLQGLLMRMPDIICLEEVDHMDDHFLPALRSLGYGGVFKKKMDAAAHDGCALLYRKSRFQLANEKGVALRDGENQVALMARLLPIMPAADGGPPQPAPELELFVVCVHYKAKPGFEAQRLLQSQALADHITAFVTATATAPHNRPKPLPAPTISAADAAGAVPRPPVDLSQLNLIVCGDFNEEWPLPPVQFFATDFVAAATAPPVVAAAHAPAMSSTATGAGGAAAAAAAPTGDAKAAAPTVAAAGATGAGAKGDAKAGNTAAMNRVVMGGHTYNDKEGMALSKFEIADPATAGWTRAHPFRLQSLYETYHPAPFFTTAKKRAVTVKRTIDYLWYNPQHLQPLSILKLLTEAELPNLLPAANYPSDHLSLFGVFRFR